MQIRACITSLNVLGFGCFLFYPDYEVLCFSFMAMSCVEMDMSPEGVGAWEAL